MANDERYQENKTGPGMWSFEVPKEKRVVTEEFINRISQEHNLGESFRLFLLSLSPHKHQPEPKKST